jgi:hypothetical protein
MNVAVEREVFDPRRICIVSPYGGRGNISGIQIRLRLLAENLNRLGFEVHVIGPYEDIEGATTHNSASTCRSAQP